MLACTAERRDPSRLFPHGWNSVKISTMAIQRRTSKIHSRHLDDRTLSTLNYSGSLSDRRIDFALLRDGGAPSITSCRRNAWIIRGWLK
jgi:hypothetical protein